MIGLAPAFVSAGFFMFTKTLKMPILMVPGFVLWAFAAGYTVFQFVKSKKNKTEQVSLFDNHSSKIEEQIKATDVNNLTPMQALTILSDLKKQLEED